MLVFVQVTKNNATRFCNRMLPIVFQFHLQSASRVRSLTAFESYNDARLHVISIRSMRNWRTSSTCSRYNFASLRKPKPKLIYFEIMRGAGLFLQKFALLLLPLAVLLELSGVLGRQAGLADMLKMMVVGIIAFILGRMMEGYAGATRSWFFMAWKKSWVFFQIHHSGIEIGQNLSCECNHCGFKVGFVLLLLCFVSFNESVLPNDPQRVRAIQTLPILLCDSFVT